MPEENKVATATSQQQENNEGERLQYWSEILRAHPVSEEYKSAHSKAALINWTPEGLVTAERYIESVVEKGRQALNDAGRYDDRQSRSVIENINELNKITDTEGQTNETNELKLMMKDNSTSLGQFVDWYRRYYLRKVETLLEEAHIYAGILNDVRTGHAGTSFMDSPGMGSMPVPAPAV
jgi:hypothetical protein